MSDKVIKGFSPNVNLWLDVKANVELDIISGVYEYGKRMPTIKQLADIYSIGETTAQKILDSLVDDEIITKIHGKGYFVKMYVKDTLLSAHKEELKTRSLALAKYGKRLSIGKDEFVDIIGAAYDSD